MDIETVAINYLNEPCVKIQKEAKKVVRKRNRKALVAIYDRAVKKYSKEKAIVESIKIQATSLKEQYDAHKKEMDTCYTNVLELREQINKMDDDGVDYMEIVLEETDDDNNNGNMW